MIKTSKTNITMTRGDSAYIRVRAKNSDSTNYIYKEGDVLHVQVRTPDLAEVVIEGNIAVDSVKNKHIWILKPEDTKDLDIGTYVWDAQIETADGDVFTFIPLSDFTLTTEVTKKVW